MKVILDELYQVLELQITQAIKNMNVRKCASLAEAARKHRVPPFCLRRC